MKKLTIAFLALILSTGSMQSQIADVGIIPVGITLNSILRLTITGGGNLEYAVNTIDDYTNGVGPTAPYITTFTVASSIEFDVFLYADNVDFIGVSGAGNSMPVGNLGYSIAVGAGGGGAANWTLIAGVNDVKDALNEDEIIDGSALLSAGDVNQNTFILNWELATAAVQASSGLTSLLLQDLSSDRYVANVILDLRQAD
jgi:hypothetical protein